MSVFLMYIREFVGLDALRANKCAYNQMIKGALLYLASYNAL